MTEFDPLGARLAIQNAQFALQRGQTTEARRLAMEAAQFDPTFEDPWLILATLSSPRASVAYLQHALEINPRSQRAIKGMQWALDRLSQTQEREQLEQKVSPVAEELPAVPPPPPLETTQPTPVQLPEEPPAQAMESFATDADLYREFMEQEHSVQPEGKEEDAKAKTQPIKVQTGKKAKAGKKSGQKKSRNLTCLTLLVIFVIVAAAVVALWFALPSWLALTNTASAALPAQVLAKPSLTPTNTATPTPTLTPTPEPTKTPRPTETPYPTPTDAPYVYPTDVTYPTSSVDASGRWIDVDLTNQMLYAYEDSTLVGSFLVSTGVAAHPTVTGQYYIYVKYTSTLMTGPGYYLPDVPYTMYFYQGYGIHGTYWHNNFGTPMSHGCVNMRTSEAEWLFNWASVGTLVNVHY